MASNKSQSIVEFFENVTLTTTTAPFSANTFQIFILIIAAVGLFANATVLSIFASKMDARKKTTNILIMNQLTLDMLSCALLTTSHSIQLSSGYLSGLWGTINCFLFISDTVPFITLYGSIASLVLITFERYVKIIHSIAHRKYFKPWMMWVGIAFTWINGILLSIAVIWTTQVVDGVCQAYAFWPNGVVQVNVATPLAWEFKFII